MRTVPVIRPIVYVYSPLRIVFHLITAQNKRGDKRSPWRRPNSVNLNEFNFV